jgi:hypothetical protein
VGLVVGDDADAPTLQLVVSGEAGNRGGFPGPEEAADHYEAYRHGCAPV